MRTSVAEVYWPSPALRPPAGRPAPVFVERNVPDFMRSDVEMASTDAELVPDRRGIGSLDRVVFRTARPRARVPAWDSADTAALQLPGAGAAR
jgi:hypothetical protein